jgi:hypothetical protein
MQLIRISKICPKEKTLEIGPIHIAVRYSAWTQSKYLSRKMLSRSSTNVALSLHHPICLSFGIIISYTSSLV